MESKRMGKLIIKGHGRDLVDEKKHYTIMVLISIVCAIVIFFSINAISQEHRIDWNESVYGIRIGDTIFPAFIPIIIAVMILVGFDIGYIVKTRCRFDSEVSVFDKIVSGTSNSKETFELSYNEISSVYAQDGSGWEGSWKSVNINANGKIYQIHTAKYRDIATEINNRRNELKQNAPPDVLAHSQQSNKHDSENPLLRRAFIFLEDSDWDKAEELLEQVLNQEPENAKAYIGKLCIELGIKHEEDLLSCETDFREYRNYKRGMQFADDEYKKTLEHYTLTTEERAKHKQEQEDEEKIREIVDDLLTRIEHARKHYDDNAYESLIAELEELCERHVEAAQMWLEFTDT